MTIIKKQKGTFKHVIELNPFPKGIYLVNILKNNQSISTKIVKD